MIWKSTIFQLKDSCLILRFLGTLGILIIVCANEEIPRSKHTEEITEALLNSLKNHRAQACEGQRLSLKCPSHTVILVETTFYGRLIPSSELCPPSEKQMRRKMDKAQSSKKQLWEEKYEDTSCDVTDAHLKVVAKCNDHKKCKIFAKPQFFGRDPCPTTSKYLQISYKCKPTQFNNGYHCEDGSMHLSCRPKKRLAVWSAVYGRTVDARLPPSAPTDCPSSQNVSYDCTVDVLPKMISLCHAQRKCSLPITDDHLGNPCPRDVRKYLNLIYICVNENIFNEAALEGRLEPIGSGDQELTDLFFASKPSFPSQKKESNPHVNNDAAFAPNVPPKSLNPFDETTPAGPERQIPGTCLPPSIPNAIGFLHEWIATFSFLKENKEKLILYFFLSSSVGLILLLASCIFQQCTTNRYTPAPSKRNHTDTYGSKIELESIINSPTAFDAESRVEMSDFGRNGVSFMHFNHPTPPRTQTLQHYYS